MPRKSVSGERSGNDSESDDATSMSERSRRLSTRGSVYHSIYNHLKKMTREDGTSLVYALRLPNKRSHPEYYDTVINPIDPDKISTKVKGNNYQSVEEMAEDIKLLVSNTRSFFGADSQESCDVMAFEEAFKFAVQVQENASPSNAPSISSTASSSVRSGRRMKRKETDGEDTDIEAASIAASEVSETSSGSHRINVTEHMLESFFASIVSYKTEKGRSIAPTFSTLPSKQLYPQYYEVIACPVDLRIIAQKIINGSYHTFGEIERDFVTMARNAKHFNEPKSRIYQDAATLLRVIKEKKNEVKKFGSKSMDEDEDVEVNVHELTMDYANLPDLKEILSPVSKMEEDDAEDEEDDEEGDEAAANSDDDDEDYTGGSASSRRRRGRPPASSTGSNSSSVKRGRGRPRKQQPIDTQSPTTSDGNASAPQTPGALGAAAGSMTVPADVVAALKLDEHVPPLGSPPHMTPFVDPNLTSEEQLIPSMLSTAAAGSLRWWGEHVLEAICTAKNAMGTVLALPFMRLPSKKMYPDYFRRITEPICLAKIRRKIKRNEYNSLADVRNDLDRVFLNAQTYNMEGSDIHNVAVYLHNLTKIKFVELSQIVVKLEGGLTPTGVKRRQSARPFGGGSEDVTPTKRRHPMTAEEARNKRLQNLFNSVYNHVDEDGHRPRDTFLVLPSREEYPDYYEVIQEPIDLALIRERMDTNKYPMHQAMVADLRLMFNNARRYNEEESQVYRDADTLDRVVKKRLKSLGPYASCPPGMSSRSPGMRPQPELYGTLAPHAAGPAIPPLVRMMHEVFATVREYRDSMGRQLSVPFLRLPSRDELPTYYEFIKQPVEMQEMAKSLVQGGYSDFGEFMNSLFLMFDNACAFNEPDSQIFKDALVLHQVALAKRNMLLSAAFSSGQLIPNLPPSSPPDIGAGVRRLLTSLHNAMLTACDSDGRGLVDSLIAGDGTETSVTSATAARLAALHRSVAKGDYRRLDRLQTDWLDVLRRARVGEERDCVNSLSEIVAKSNRPTPQQRQDAAELARRWVRLRDSMCRRVVPQDTVVTTPATGTTEKTPGESSGSDSSIGGVGPHGSSLPAGLHIVSTAMSYTEVVLDRDLNEELNQNAPLVFGDDDGEEELAPLVEGEHEMQSIESKGQVYRVGDYVYVESSSPDATQAHIGRITRISEVPSAETPEGEMTSGGGEESVAPATNAGTGSGVKVHIALYMRPCEAKPSKRRRLLAAEVFRTASSLVAVPNKLIGHCLVMHISHFIRSRPKNIEERDVYVCESQYSIIGEIFVKIKRWGVPTPSGIELEDRQIPFVPQRLPPSEPLESALEQVQTQSFNAMTFPILRPLQIVEDQTSMSEGTISYEQYVSADSSVVVKQGDCLYVSSPNGAAERQILLVDKIWKNASEDNFHVTGCIFVFPVEVEHLPTRVFLPREVFLTGNDRATFPITAAQGKCFVMRPADFFIARPTGYREADVFVCESKYIEDEEEKTIRKLKKGFKKYKFTAETMEDEYFFFNQPISPHKEASPLLVKSSPAPLSMEQLNRPPSAALASVMAAANGLTTTPCASHHHDSQTPLRPAGAEYAGGVPRLAPAPTISADVGQQAFMEAGLDRTGKKRKLRKPPSGYVIYAGEVRKKLLQDRPDAPFGEISREVGLMWRQMPSHERDIYEHKAQVIKRRMEEEETHQKARLLEQEKMLAVQQHHEMMPLQQPVDQHHPHPPSQAHIVLGSQPQQLTPQQPHSQQAPPPQMQFYQPTSGASAPHTVIQMMHAPAAMNGGAGVGGPRSDQPLVASAAAVLANPMSHAPVLTTHGGQQVVYQFSGQQAPGMVGAQQNTAVQGHQQAPPNVSICGPQVILTQQQHPHHPQSPYVGQHHQQHPQQFTMARQVQVVQQSNALDGSMNGGVNVPSTAVVPQPVAAAVQHHHSQQIQQQQQHHQVAATPAAAPVVAAPPTQPPSPLFVSVPPRTSRVLHSEIYQRYIDRLRRNSPGLSDWKRQLCMSAEGLPPLAPQQHQHLATNFLDMPQLHAHQGTIVDALWSLRDNLLKDSLNIRTRALGFEEL